MRTVFVVDVDLHSGAFLDRKDEILLILGFHIANELAQGAADNIDVSADLEFLDVVSLHRFLDIELADHEGHQGGAANHRLLAPEKLAHFALGLFIEGPALRTVIAIFH